LIKTGDIMEDGSVYMGTVPGKYRVIMLRLGTEVPVVVELLAFTGEWWTVGQLGERTGSGEFKWSNKYHELTINKDLSDNHLLQFNTQACPRLAELQHQTIAQLPPHVFNGLPVLTRQRFCDRERAMAQ